MRAVRLHEKGGPEVLRVDDVPEPTPGPDEVLIRVKSVGVNFADHLMRIGAYPAGELPITPGLEAVGTVERTGSNVLGLQAGQSVLAWTRPTYAELAVAPAWAVQPAPAGLSFDQLAAIPVAYGTAWHALVTCARLQPSERVLVHAAGSGVGSAAIALAKALGAWVIATAGQDWKLERARALGADATVNYATQDVAAELQKSTDGQGVHVALEGVGKATFAASVASLAPEGRLVIYGAPSGPRVELDTRLPINRNLTLFGMSITTSPAFRDSIAAFARNALPWFSSRKLAPIVDRVYPLVEAGVAHQRMMDRDLFGKLILHVAD
ncbi:MAG TPA: zinc-binding dehydrogenase [Chloroflexota bacterium]